MFIIINRIKIEIKPNSPVRYIFNNNAMIEATNIAFFKFPNIALKNPCSIPLELASEMISAFVAPKEKASANW